MYVQLGCMYVIAIVCAPFGASWVNSFNPPTSHSHTHDSNGGPFTHLDRNNLRQVCMNICRLGLHAPEIVKLRDSIYKHDLVAAIMCIYAMDDRLFVATLLF